MTDFNTPEVPKKSNLFTVPKNFDEAVKNIQVNLIEIFEWFDDLLSGNLNNYTNQREVMKRLILVNQFQIYKYGRFSSSAEFVQSNLGILILNFIVGIDTDPLHQSLALKLYKQLSDIDYVYSIEDATRLIDLLEVQGNKDFLKKFIDKFESEFNKLDTSIKESSGYQLEHLFYKDRYYVGFEKIINKIKAKTNVQP